MALSKDAVDKAFYLFKKIDKRGGSFFHECPDYATNFDTGRLFGLGPKADDGWENVWINVQDMTASQRATWEARKKEVPNTSFTTECHSGITRLGFF